jgi:hypothetical protein
MSFYPLYIYIYGSLIYLFRIVFVHVIYGDQILVILFPFVFSEIR